MKANGLTKVETLELLKSVDLIGLTLTMEQMTGNPIPANIKDHLIVLLGDVRFQLAKSFDLNISSMETTGIDSPTKHHTTPAEVADKIVSDLKDDQSWRDYEDEYWDEDDFKNFKNGS